jgi:hypothetical protein
LETQDLNAFTESCREEDASQSLEAAYFGRPIEVRSFHFPIVDTLEKRLQLITNVLDRVFKDHDKYSKPTKLISEIDDEKILAYYIWQYKESDDETNMKIS